MCCELFAFCLWKNLNKLRRWHISWPINHWRFTSLLLAGQLLYPKKFNSNNSSFSLLYFWPLRVAGVKKLSANSLPSLVFCLLAVLRNFDKNAACSCEIVGHYMQGFEEIALQKKFFTNKNHLKNANKSNCARSAFACANHEFQL